MAGNASLSYLRGVGPKRASVLNEAGIMTIDDLYDYFPRRYLDRRIMKSIGSVRDGETVTVVGRVLRTQIEGKNRGNARFKAWLGDDTGVLELTWFRGVRYFSRTVVPDEVLAVHGKVNYFGHQLQMSHPDYDRLSLTIRDRQEAEESDIELYRTGKIIPLYPATEAMREANLSSKQLRTIMAKAFEDYPPGVTENLSREILDANALLPLDRAYREIHFPSSPELLQRARYRMKWTELFFAQLLFALRHNAIRQQRTAASFTHSGEVTKKLYESLPYNLTGAQKNAVREIYHDLRSGRPMNRLLQGDVGSGKTIVAMFSMALAADNGFQSAFMAPTEILAVQHYLVMKRLFKPLGLHVGLLTGKQRKKEREATLCSLESGELQIAVGTHAMIEEGVIYHGLGLVIIDEQHRFGVLQRKALREKAVNPHVLLMTATPIPRTLAMGAFGDLDVSVIRELPAGRRPVRTILRHEDERRKVYDFLRSSIAEGRQGYIVYPLVEESEKVDLKAAVESFGELSSEIFPDLRLGLIHGQMTPEQKEDVMDRFRSGELQLLVGTTVIEVGVDVPNATVMVIEHAERFGLAQLHQLRGRVGRAKHLSTCFLLYAKQTQDARERLEAMVSTTDGFVISEIDARIRGAGNILGKEQSGTLSGLKIADINTDFTIMQSAREAAFGLIACDGRLEEPGHGMIRAHYLRHYHGKMILADIG
ncbi:MAG: ATP-dependent DNA helicase RecG [Chlorobiaceae bacterium]|nr:ATP-dependent DNA helicase RecG [Chlorobiaceae bacterium]NTV59731.1 ATP-dependent DNA helicase RecG [Chlorobiaceae bacterium]